VKPGKHLWQLGLVPNSALIMHTLVVPVPVVDLATELPQLLNTPTHWRHVTLDTSLTDPEWDLEGILSPLSWVPTGIMATEHSIRLQLAPGKPAEQVQNQFSRKGDSEFPETMPYVTLAYALEPISETQISSEVDRLTQQMVSRRISASSVEHRLAGPYGPFQFRTHRRWGATPS